MRAIRRDMRPRERVRATAVVGFLVLAMEIVVLLVFMVSAVVVLAHDGSCRCAPLLSAHGFEHVR